MTESGVRPYEGLDKRIAAIVLAAILWVDVNLPVDDDGILLADAVNSLLAEDNRWYFNAKGLTKKERKHFFVKRSEN